MRKRPRRQTLPPFATSQRENDAGDELYKIGLPGKSILGDCFQENMTSRRPFFFLRISFPGRPIFIQFVPGDVLDLLGALRLPDVVLPHPHAVRARAALHVLEVWIGCYGFFTQWGGLSVVMF